jgi:hypothetical protein
MSQWSPDSQEEADYYDSGAAEAEAQQRLQEEDINYINKQEIKSMDFLPKDYETPKSSGAYMKFLDGKNKFRILGSAIVGYEWWIETSEGGRKPGRSRTFQEAVELGIEPIKHFWAFPVWDYKEEAVKILEVTQKGIMSSIKALVDDEDWGDPKEYDISVTRTGEKMETKYSVTPSPKKPVDAGIVAMYKDMDIKLDALYSGADPFAK